MSGRCAVQLATGIKLTLAWLRTIGFFCGRNYPPAVPTRCAMLSKTKMCFALVMFTTAIAPVLASTYHCKTKPCVQLGTPMGSSGSWIVGEIRMFAFGDDAASFVTQDLNRLGWVECAGQPLPRAAFKKLYNVMGDTWGSGDGSTDFNLPDLRGAFVRGWDHEVPSGPKRPTSGGDEGLQDRTAPRTEASSPATPGNTEGVGTMQLDDQKFLKGILGPPCRPGNKYNGQDNAQYCFDNGKDTHPKNFYVIYAIYVGEPVQLDSKTGRFVPRK